MAEGKLETFFTEEMKLSVNVREIRRIIPEKGLAIVELDSSGDKERLMRGKSMLRANKKYSRVFFDHDRSFEERRKWSNIRRHINGLRESGKRVTPARGHWIVDGAPYIWCDDSSVLIPSASGSGNLFRGVAPTEGGTQPAPRTN